MLTNHFEIDTFPTRIGSILAPPCKATRGASKGVYIIRGNVFIRLCNPFQKSALFAWHVLNDFENCILQTHLNRIDNFYKRKKRGCFV